MASMPLDFISVRARDEARHMLLMAGRRVGPGTANSATFLPLNTSAVDLPVGPSGPMTVNFASGSWSPTLIVMT